MNRSNLSSKAVDDKRWSKNFMCKGIMMHINIFFPQISSDCYTISEYQDYKLLHVVATLRHNLGINIRFWAEVLIIS